MDRGQTEDGRRTDGGRTKDRQRTDGGKAENGRRSDGGWMDDGQRTDGGCKEDNNYRKEDNAKYEDYGGMARGGQCCYDYITKLN